MGGPSLDFARTSWIGCRKDVNATDGISPKSPYLALARASVVGPSSQGAAKSKWSLGLQCGVPEMPCRGHHRREPLGRQPGAVEVELRQMHTQRIAVRVTAGRLQ
jgi:hypothetical protein